MHAKTGGFLEKNTENPRGDKQKKNPRRRPLQKTLKKRNKRKEEGAANPILAAPPPSFLSSPFLPRP
jgi:hypothetical protein